MISGRSTGIQDIGLELHREIIGAGSSIDAQFAQINAAFIAHQLQNITGLIGDGF